MSRITSIVLGTAALLAVTGCSSTNRIVGHNLTQAGHWYGELGITGDGNNITVESGSRLTKLSVLGSGNRVTMEERCSLGKIELWGENNTVHLPDYLVVRITQWGEANQIVRHGPEGVTPMPRFAADREAEAPEQPPVIQTAPADEVVDESAEPDRPVAGEPAEPDQPAADEPAKPDQAAADDAGTDTE